MNHLKFTYVETRRRNFVKPMPIQSNRVKARTTDKQAADDHPLDQVGEEIRRLRRSRGMSITDLAKKIGRSVGFVSQIDRGMSKPSVKRSEESRVGTDCVSTCRSRWSQVN